MSQSPPPAEAMQSLAGYVLHRLGNPDAPLRLIWAHGWGHDHRAFQPACQSFLTCAENLLLDLPGFGAAPVPPLDWGTADYADAAARMIAALPPKKTIWIGHSYGSRVGVQLAGRHPESVAGMVLVSAAGLPRQRTLSQKIARSFKIASFKAMKALARSPEQLEALRNRHGSADYRAAGVLRPILIKAVNEDLSEQARRITCPVHLLYGGADQDTPPEIGQRFNTLIPGSRLHIIPNLNHWTILSDGKYQIAMVVEKLMGMV